MLFGLSKGSETMTKTVESGLFIRTKWRKGKKTKTKTLRMTKNKKKVILGHIGDFEVYVYPYDYPDSVFVGRFPTSTKIEASNLNQLISAYNRARSYLNGYYLSGDNWRKGANTRRGVIRKAYNQGLSAIRSKE